MENFERYYPPKPILEKQKRNAHVSITLLSMLIFAITFYFIIDDYLLIALLLGVLFFHELGHFLVMKIFNYHDMNMLFIPFLGAMVMGKKKEYSQKETALMLLAGPLPGIFIGATLLLFTWIEPQVISIQLGVMLVLLNVFNLIPVSPLDGGQLFRTLFSRRYELTQFLFSLFTSAAFLILGFYTMSWFFMAIGLLLGFRVKKQHKMYLIRKEMRKNEIPYSSNYEDISDRTYSEIKSIVIFHTPVLQKIMSMESDELEVNQLIAQQVDNVLYPPTKKDASFLFKLIIFLLWIGGMALSLYSLLSVEINTVLNAFQIR